MVSPNETVFVQSYDPKSRTIEVTYLTDDLTEFCICDEESEQDLGYSHYDSIDGKVETLQCSCLFKFDGINFGLIKSSIEKVIDE